MNVSRRVIGYDPQTGSPMTDSTDPARRAFEEAVDALEREAYQWGDGKRNGVSAARAQVMALYDAAVQGRNELRDMTFGFMDGAANDAAHLASVEQENARLREGLEDAALAIEAEGDKNYAAKLRALLSPPHQENTQ